MTGPELTALPPTVRDLGMQARRAARVLRSLDTARKRAALLEIARELQAHAAGILAANARDMEAAQGLPPAMLARLHLTPAGLDALIRDVQAVADLPDPVGERTAVQTQPSGIRVSQLRVPLGVLGVIYESRPNVTVDVAALALMSGNAVILRGGKETVYTNAALEDAIRSALRMCELPDAAVQVIRDPDRDRVRELLRLDDLVDAIIPRGGAGLHRFCVENATVPVIVGGIGVVHLYLDGSFTRDPADVQRAAHLIVNAKVQKPSACNALDTLLLDREALPALPTVARALVAEGVELRADPEGLAVLLAAGVPAEAATDADYGQEFLALTVSLRTVAGLDEALEFIAAHGNHTDVILTRDDAQARRFVQDVDSAAVMVNASPRFNDGAQLGLGAEVAISTQKLHARGPMGLRELTTLKWVVEGDGHLRT